MSSVDTQGKYIELLQRGGEPELFGASDPIFGEGDPADRMYIVKSGTVVLTKGEEPLETVGPGGLFGELALIDRGSRSAGAVAETDCELVAIDTRRFWFLVQETPYFAEIVMRIMADRLRRRTS